MDNVIQLKPKPIEPTPYQVHICSCGEDGLPFIDIYPPVERLNDTARLQLQDQALVIMARVSKNP